MKTRLRYVEVLDYAQLAAIDRQSYDLPWGVPEFERVMRLPRMIGVLGERLQWRYAPPEVVAFIIYRRLPSHSEILRMAVAPQYRRQGLGLWMLERIPTCPELRISVPDTMLGAHLFLRELGFKATKVVPDPARPGEAAYRFRCRVTMLSPESA
jgi:ribosomal protein S18 acetylase RimI-like enzyme